MQNKRLVKRVLACVVLLVLLGVVGRMDYNDEVMEADQYCKQVYAGVWPDYRDIYDRECVNGRHYLVAK